MNTDTITSGLHNLTWDQYRGLNAISRSDLLLMTRSPAHYRHHMDNRTAVTSKALNRGIALHGLLLEPERIATQVVIKPDGMEFRSNADKKWRDDHLAAGMIILSSDEMKDINGMDAAIRKHPTAGPLMAKGQAEMTGLYGGRKCRYDWLPDPSLKRSAVLPIIDIKTAENAGIEEFSKSILFHNYHIQAAFYLDIAIGLGLAWNAWMFIAVEPEAPYAVACYQLSEDSIALGRSKYTRLLSTLDYCTKMDEWPGYTEDIKMISVPEWALKQGGQM